jgi:hypothetical protein
MTDIVELAVSQRDELKGEIAKLDKFISTARKLMEQAGAGDGAAGASDQEQQGDESASRAPLFRR